VGSLDAHKRAFIFLSSLHLAFLHTRSSCFLSSLHSFTCFGLFCGSVGSVRLACASGAWMWAPARRTSCVMRFYSGLRVWRGPAPEHALLVFGLLSSGSSSGCLCLSLGFVRWTGTGCACASGLRSGCGGAVRHSHLGHGCALSVGLSWTWVWPRAPGALACGFGSCLSFAWARACPCRMWCCRVPEARARARETEHQPDLRVV
jgi:hypothetical protein